MTASEHRILFSRGAAYLLFAMLMFWSPDYPHLADDKSLQLSHSICR